MPVLKFNTLTNTVWPATEHHDFFAISRIRLALFFIGRVHVSRVGRKFAGAGINPLINRAQVHGMTLLAHGLVGGFHQLGQTTIGKTFLFEREQSGFVDGIQCLRFEPQFDVDDLLDLR